MNRSLVDPTLQRRTQRRIPIFCGKREKDLSIKRPDQSSTNTSMNQPTLLFGDNPLLTTMTNKMPSVEESKEASVKGSKQSSIFSFPTFPTTLPSLFKNPEKNPEKKPEIEVQLENIYNKGGKTTRRRRPTLQRGCKKRRRSSGRRRGCKKTYKKRT